MTKAKKSPSLVRASVAEYLTFLTASGESGTQAIYAGDGKVSAEIAHTHALSEFEQYRIIQDCLYQSDFDKQLAISTDNSTDEQNHQGDSHE